MKMLYGVCNTGDLITPLIFVILDSGVNDKLVVDMTLRLLIQYSIITTRM